MNAWWHHPSAPVLAAGDPLPEATIKFFIKAGARVATTWVS